MEVSGLADLLPSTRHLLTASFNIRYDNPNDGEDNWQHRKDDVLKFMVKLNPHIFGLQEALHHQLTAFGDSFPNYSFIGVARNDGKKKGEYNPIFYNNKMFSLLDSGTFWLGPQPNEIGSKFDGVRLRRICTWGKFKWNDAGDEISMGNQEMEFYFLNTHLDHESSSIRTKQIEVILNFIKNTLDQDTPLILTGDFNAENDSECIKAVRDSHILAQASKTASIIKEATTFPGFHCRRSEVIDHIWYKGFKSLLYAVLTDKRENKRLLSDHRPIAAVFQAS